MGANVLQQLSVDSEQLNVKKQMLLTVVSF